MTAPDAALPAQPLGGGDAAESARPRPRGAALFLPVPAGATDTDLLERARGGDRAAFGELVRRHHRSLAAILRPSCGASVPMEDLLQEVFARSLAHVGGFRGGSSFLTWAVTIGRHLASDWRRQSERRSRLAPTVDIDDVEAACPRSGHGVQAAERRDDVERARRELDALPERMRIAVTLRVLDDLTYEEVAERMSAPPPRVRQWVCRGLRRLRESLQRGGRTQRPPEDGHGA